MRRKFAIPLLFLTFACSESTTVEQSSDQFEMEEPLLSDTVITEESSEIITKIAFPAAVIDDPCLPYPSEEFLHYLEFDSTFHVYGETNLLHNYCVAHFDSTTRISHEVEDEYDMGKYHWEQSFSNGIKYDEYYGGEGGSTATLSTQCTNKTALFSTLNAMLNYGRVVPEWEYDDNSVWNSDSSEFAPSDGGVGCYYTIIKNDSTGFYSVDNYCGC